MLKELISHFGKDKINTFTKYPSILMTHSTILNNLNKFIPQTNVQLSQNALKKPEGLVLRNHDRSKIVKIRFEDYERILKQR